MAEQQLREVEWLDHDYVYQDGAQGRPRTCDICYESFSDDVSGDTPKTIRKFYFDDAEQLTVCEHCVEKYLSTPGGE